MRRVTNNRCTVTDQQYEEVFTLLHTLKQNIRWSSNGFFFEIPVPSSFKSVRMIPWNPSVHPKEWDVDNVKNGAFDVASFIGFVFSMSYTDARTLVQQVYTTEGPACGANLTGPNQVSFAKVRKNDTDNEPETRFLSTKRGCLEVLNKLIHSTNNQRWIERANNPMNGWIGKVENVVKAFLDCLNSRHMNQTMSNQTDQQLSMNHGNIRNIHGQQTTPHTNASLSNADLHSLLTNVSSMTTKIAEEISNLNKLLASNATDPLQRPFKKRYCLQISDMDETN